MNKLLHGLSVLHEMEGFLKRFCLEFSYVNSELYFAKNRRIDGDIQVLLCGPFFTFDCGGHYPGIETDESLVFEQIHRLSIHTTGKW